MNLGQHWFCARCKPGLVQRLREGELESGRLRYAGFWPRFLAKVIDAVLLYLLQLPLAVAIGVSPLDQPDPDFFATDSMSFWGPRLLVGALGLLLGFGYNAGFVGRLGATPGKMVLGLRVVLPDGSSPSYRRALGRTLAEWVTGFTCTLGYLMAAFDREKRSLHDRVAGTRVIRRAPAEQGSALSCEICSAAIADDLTRGETRVSCQCSERYRFVAFDAAFGLPLEVRPSLREAPQQASCFFHDQHRPSATCASCGRLLCALCAIALGDQPWCANCLTAAADSEPALQRERSLEDSITLLWAVLPLGFWPITPVTAVIVLYRTVRDFGTRQSVVPRSRVRFVLAGTLASVELLILLVGLTLLLGEGASW